MSVTALKQIRSAISHVNPAEVRKMADLTPHIGLVASATQGCAAIEDYLIPAAVSHQRRTELMQLLHRAGDPDESSNVDLVFYEQGLACPDYAFTFYLQHPERTVNAVLEAREDLHIALARRFPPFRKPVVERLIQSVSRENALFALLTALPNSVPSLIGLPWAIGEFASDTAFLTVNQIRLAFLLAAASDREAGYTEQRTEIASIITAAFGWRALARELAGKIPLGGGLIPKAAIAWAGTWVVGQSLERFNRFGYGYSRAERREAYQEAFERGKAVAEQLVGGLRKRIA